MLTQAAPGRLSLGGPARRSVGGIAKKNPAATGPELQAHLGGCRRAARVGCCCARARSDRSGIRVPGDRRSPGAGGGPRRRLEATAAGRHRRCSRADGARCGSKHEARAPTRCAYECARTARGAVVLVQLTLGRLLGEWCHPTDWSLVRHGVQRSTAGRVTSDARCARPHGVWRMWHLLTGPTCMQT